ncbi:MAG: hypothetical protein RSA91_04410 [Bacilli bacterium]
MKRFTFRLDDFTYNKVKLLSKQYRRSMTSVLKELVQVGFNEVMKRGIYENKDIYK